MTHFRVYLYGNRVRIYTDHSAVKAVLLAPNPSGKYARWCGRVYRSGIKEVDIVYRPDKWSANADALLRSPLPDSTTAVAKERDSESLVGAVKSKTSSASENISELLSTVSENPEGTLPFAEEQHKDSVRRSTVLHRSKLKSVHHRRIAVLKHLRKELLDKTH